MYTLRLTECLVPLCTRAFVINPYFSPFHFFPTLEVFQIPEPMVKKYDLFFFRSNVRTLIGIIVITFLICM